MKKKILFLISVCFFISSSLKMGSILEKPKDENKEILIYKCRDLLKLNNIKENRITIKLKLMNDIDCKVSDF